MLVKDARMISDALKTEATLLCIRQGTGTQATFPVLLSTALSVSLAYLSPLSSFWENRFGEFGHWMLKTELRNFHKAFQYFLSSHHQEGAGYTSCPLAL